MKESTVRYTAEDIEEMRRRGEDRTDRERIDRMTDEERRAARARDPDAVELPEDWPEHTVAGLPEEPMERPAGRQRSPRRHGGGSMPEISRFFGIIIAMFYNDHDPRHFHVRYGGQRALIDIETLAVLEGRLSPRVLGLVVEWAASHQGEMRANWERAWRHQPLAKVEPLE